MKTLLEEAQDAIDSGDTFTAYNKFKELLNFNPDVPEAWYGISLCIDDFKNKEFCLNKAIKLNPNYQKAINSLWLIQLQLDPEVNKNQSSELSQKNQIQVSNSEQPKYNNGKVDSNLIEQKKGKKGNDLTFIGKGLGVAAIIFFAILLCYLLFANSDKKSTNLTPIYSIKACKDETAYLDSTQNIIQSGGKLYLGSESLLEEIKNNPNLILDSTETNSYLVLLKASANEFGKFRDIVPPSACLNINNSLIQVSGELNTAYSLFDYGFRNVDTNSIGTAVMHLDNASNIIEQVNQELN